MPLLFTYGINRFSRDVVHIYPGDSNEYPQNMNMHEMFLWRTEENNPDS